MTVLLGAIAIASGTWFGWPTLAPVIAGLVIGLGWPDRAASKSALAGLVAWAGLLVHALVRGGDLMSLGSSLGSAMGLPAWALFAATLAYPTLLASCAAWLGHLVTPRQFFWSPTGNYRTDRR